VLDTLARRVNEHRPLFARKALKVVLWCDRETSAALAQQAPDFFDWIAQRQECPPGVAEHAVWGLRQALRARAPGVVFVGGRRQQRDGKESLERVFHAALPRRRLVWLKPDEMPYSDLVARIRETRGAWVACLSSTYGAAERFRWALAEVGRRTRAVLVVPQGGEDWFWPVTDHVWSLEEAIKLLSRAGAEHPGRLAAVSGLEVAAIFGLLELLIRDYGEDVLLSAMLKSPDPGAGLGERISSSGILGPRRLGVAGWSPVQRRLGKLAGLRRPVPMRPSRPADGWVLFNGPGWPLLRARAYRIEYLLCSAERTAGTWTDLARLALAHDDADAAAFWASRALDVGDSVEARRIYGVARAEIGLFNLDRGYPAGLVLLAEGMAALDKVAAMLTPTTAPQDAFSVHALRADVLTRFGLPGEANDAIARTESLLDVPEVRVRDLLRLARALMRRGRSTRAEEVLRLALGRVTDREERCEGQVLLGQCALAVGRPAEALALSEVVLQDLLHGEGWDTGTRIAAERLHIDALLALGESSRALQFADEAVDGSALWWGRSPARSEQVPPPVLWRAPFLPRVFRETGRLKDAEMVLRKLLGLPITDDPASIGAGLKSQRLLEALVRGPVETRQDMRSELLAELVKVLRAQGRYAEAEALSGGDGPPPGP
jgi:tetratricopeptide (TPR) repeat protein